MEKTTGFLGISCAGWRVIGILSLLSSMVAFWALVALLFGLDIGGVIS